MTSNKRGMVWVDTHTRLATLLLASGAAQSEEEARTLAGDVGALVERSRTCDRTHEALEAWLLGRVQSNFFFGTIERGKA